MPYHFACTSGSESHCTNFQALSRFSLSLKTARLEPPTKDEEISFSGMAITEYLSAKPSPPTVSTADIIQGPEMNIGTAPLTKSGSVVGVVERGWCWRSRR